MSSIVHKFNVFLNYGDQEANAEFLERFGQSIQTYIKKDFSHHVIHAYTTSDVKPVKGPKPGVYVGIEIEVAMGRVELDLPFLRDDIALSLELAEETGKYPHISLRYMGNRIQHNTMDLITTSGSEI